MANKTGYQLYIEKFGYEFHAYKKLPAQILPWRGSEKYNKDFDKLLRDCANSNRQFTAREFVDAVYLDSEGFYSFDSFVKTRDYNDFIRKVSTLRILT